MSATLAQQIDEVERELGLRRAFYPAKVRSKQISQLVADAQMARMEAALKTLRCVRENEEKIKAAGVRLP